MEILIPKGAKITISHPDHKPIIEAYLKEDFLISPEGFIPKMEIEGTVLVYNK